MDYRVLTEAERKYTFSQSQQLSMQTGLIGYLRADFGSTGKEFYSTWNDFRKDLKTDDFKKEFDLVINSYRFGDGEFLSGRSTMSKFCYEHPESSYEDDRNQYGVRVDTERYSYLMRLNPNRGEYNLYCYCYQKEWLNNHLKNAERGIRFIDPHYQEQFRIADGEKSLNQARRRQNNGENLQIYRRLPFGGRHKSLPYLRICRALREKRSYRRTSRKRKHEIRKGQTKNTIRRCRRGGKKI